MKILFLGDVVGRSGREAIQKYLPVVKKEFQIDFTVLNGENAAHGFGITKEICQDFYKLGVDAITLGNHTWDNPDILNWINQDKKLIRPLNFPQSQPGTGYTVIELDSNTKILIINVQGQLFMPQHCDDPFASVNQVLKTFELGRNIQAIIVDFHAEATSEKLAMGHILDGRVSLVVGTHTHVPTADARILPKGTAYQTDAGMCGDYDSILGMDKYVPMQRFLKTVIKERLKPAQGPGSISGIVVETDKHTGLAKKVTPLCMGPGFPSC